MREGQCKFEQARARTHLHRMGWELRPRTDDSWTLRPRILPVEPEIFATFPEAWRAWARHIERAVNHAQCVDIALQWIARAPELRQQLWDWTLNQFGPLDDALLDDLYMPFYGPGEVNPWGLYPEELAFRAWPCEEHDLPACIRNALIEQELARRHVPNAQQAAVEALCPLGN